MSGERPALLLLHDHGRDASQWREFVPLFESRFHVLAPDVVGDDHEARLASVGRALSGIDRFGVIGHGTGGALAQTLAAGRGVEAMVLLDAPRAADVTEPQLASFDFPVLLLWGEDDRVVPVAVAEELNEAIPTSTLAVVPGCGHELADEAAATIAPLILEYLRARYLKAPHDHRHDHAHEGVVRIQLERRPPWLDLEEDERDPWFDVDDEEAAP